MYDAIISGIRNLDVNGIDSLRGRTITTQLTINDASIANAQKVKLYIDGTNDYAYDVTCSNGDKCVINCLSNTSCTNMIWNCDGVCYLDCGNYSASANGNDCPSSISGTWYPLIVTPTINPTMIPTQYPSATTVAPSQYPIVQPTKTPHMHGKSTESPMWTTSTIESKSESDNQNGGVLVLTYQIIGE